MTHPSDHEARHTSLEARVEEVAVDAAAARHLAAARDRDLADFGVKVNACRSAVNALGLQTAGRFDQVDQRFAQVDQRFDRLEQRVDQLEDKVDTGFEETRRGFTEMRGRLDQTAAGQQQIVDLLTTLISEQGDP